MTSLGVHKGEELIREAMQLIVSVLFLKKEQLHTNSGVPLYPMQLLAVSGPFHYWGPVVDGQYLREAPARALQRAPRAKVDLLIGTSQADGLISRAKAVKVGGAGASEAPAVWPRLWSSKSLT